MRGNLSNSLARRDPSIACWARICTNGTFGRLSTVARDAVRFKVPPGSTKEGGDTFRDSNVHPAERCVHCYTQQGGSNSSAAAAAAATRRTCMKTEGRKPSARFSACRSAVVKQSKRHNILPRFELPEEKCCVIPANSESCTAMAAEYPFFHGEARRPGVSELGS